MSIKRTMNNIIHANENAEAREAAEKAAKRNAMIGGVGVVITGLAGMISTHMWKKRYNCLDDRLSHIENKINLLCNNEYFEEEVGYDD